LNRDNKTANIQCKKNCSLSTTYNGEMTHRKHTAKIMNGDITLEAR